MIYVCAGVHNVHLKGKVGQAGTVELVGKVGVSPISKSPLNGTVWASPISTLDKATAQLGTTRPLPAWWLQPGEATQDLLTPSHTVEGLALLASADLTTGHMEMEPIFRQVI